MYMYRKYNLLKGDQIQSKVSHWLGDFWRFSCIVLSLFSLWKTNWYKITKANCFVIVKNIEKLPTF